MSMEFEERVSLRKRRVGCNLYLPSTLVEVVDRIADAEGIDNGFNSVFERLLRKGLEVERAERAAKAQES